MFVVADSINSPSATARSIFEYSFSTSPGMAANFAVRMRFASECTRVLVVADRLEGLGAVWHKNEQ